MLLDALSKTFKSCTFQKNDVMTQPYTMVCNNFDVYKYLSYQRVALLLLFFSQRRPNYFVINLLIESDY